MEGSISGAVAHCTSQVDYAFKVNLKLCVGPQRSLGQVQRDSHRRTRATECGLEVCSARLDGLDELRRDCEANIVNHVFDPPPPSPSLRLIGAAPGSPQRRRRVVGRM